MRTTAQGENTRAVAGRMVRLAGPNSGREARVQSRGAALRQDTARLRIGLASRPKPGSIPKDDGRGQGFECHVADPQDILFAEAKLDKTADLMTVKFDPPACIAHLGCAPGVKIQRDQVILRKLGDLVGPEAPAENERASPRSARQTVISAVDLDGIGSSTTHQDIVLGATKKRVTMRRADDTLDVGDDIALCIAEETPKPRNPGRGGLLHDRAWVQWLWAEAAKQNASEKNRGVLRVWMVGDNGFEPLTSSM